MKNDPSRHDRRRLCRTCKRRLGLSSFVGTGTICKACRGPEDVRDNDAETAAGLREADELIAAMHDIAGLKPPAPDYPDIADHPGMDRGLVEPL